MTPAELRAMLIDRTGSCCQWPGCTWHVVDLVHIEHRGMGGSETANRPGNVLLLCRQHHDEYDGRARLRSLGDLVEATVSSSGRRPRHCPWPECDRTPTVWVRSGAGRWLCSLHAQVVDTSKPLPGRRREVARLLRLVAEGLL